MQYRPAISNEELSKLENTKFEGKIHIIKSLEQVDYAYAQLKKCTIIGFDTETKPSFKKGKSNKNKVALLQLSTEAEAFLFRIHYIGIPQAIAQILSDKNILKIGVALHDDFKNLIQVNKSIKPAGMIDLQNIVQDYGIENFSLKKITGIVLNQKISKRQQLSNWENEELSEEQGIYAATDAWIALKIYKQLKNIQ